MVGMNYTKLNFNPNTCSNSIGDQQQYLKDECVYASFLATMNTKIKINIGTVISTRTPS